VEARLLLLLVIVVATTCAFSQTNATLPVCVVAGTSNFSHSLLSPNYSLIQRHSAQMLANYLNSHTFNGAGQPKIEALTLTNLAADSILGEARDKGCPYVVQLEVGTKEPSKSAGSELRNEPWNEPWNYVGVNNGFLIFNVYKVSNGKPLPSDEFVCCSNDVIGPVIAKVIYADLKKNAEP
jgi:hypothetical protein